MRFVRVVESVNFNGPMAAANAVFTALWPVARPLTVYLTIVARLHDFSFIIYKVPVPVSEWILREMYLPNHVAIPSWVACFKPNEPGEEEVPELTLPALADWLTCAHAQQLPEGYIPVLHTLEVRCTRARLLEYQKPYGELALGPQTYTIPVEKRDNGLWVSGPTPEAMGNAPIEISLENVDGRLGLDISVYWSPWIEKGSGEAELLRICLHELEKQGWEGEKRTTDWPRET